MQYEFLERLDIGHDNAQQIVGLAGHQITLHDFRSLQDGILKNFQRLFDLLFECDLNEYTDFETDLQRVQQ